MSHPAHRARLLKETAQLETTPPPGVTAWRVDGDSMTHWHATLRGPADTPYAGGLFKLDVRVPARYPFEPPSIQFLTPVHHPNIDAAGRICLDTLNMPPKGSWNPGSNLSSTLTSILQLLTYPNPSDGLVSEITAQFTEQHAAFVQQAKEMTRRHAMQKQTATDKEPAAAAAAAATAVAPVAAEPAAAVSATAPAATSSTASAASSSPVVSETHSSQQQPQQQPQQQEGASSLSSNSSSTLVGSKRPADDAEERAPTAENAPPATSDKDVQPSHADKKQKLQHDADHKGDAREWRSDGNASASSS
jgi:ubiquitin-conjugating enzyme E2 T